MPIIDEVSAVGATCGDVGMVTVKVSATVVLDGELDCSTERKLGGRTSRLAELADVVRIDARQVSFIDAAGVRTLLPAKRDLVKNGATMTVDPRPGPVQRILQLAGLDRFDDAATAPDCRQVAESGRVRSSRTWVRTVTRRCASEPGRCRLNGPR